MSILVIYCEEEVTNCTVITADEIITKNRQIGSQMTNSGSQKRHNFYRYIKYDCDEL